MKKTITILTFLLNLSLFSQNNPTKEAQSIVAEGKLLYQSEMASWYGTDLFIAAYSNQENIGGYFSYTDNAVSNCVFVSKAEPVKVIGTISFDSTYNLKTATTDLTERELTSNENDLFTIRKIATAEIYSDSLFVSYKNTSFNIIPIISGKEKKVYILTGPQQNGVVIFGNDYLITFDKNNKLVSKKQLHKNIIPIYYGKDVNEGKQVEATIHSHLPETGDYITATDICTLMLYEKFANWKTHNVVSEKYINIWNCGTNELIVVPADSFKNIEKEQKKKKK